MNPPSWATDNKIYTVEGTGAKSEYKNIYGEFGDKIPKINNRYD